VMKRERLTEQQAGELAAEASRSARIRGIMYAMLLAFAFITLLTACGLASDKGESQQHMHGDELWETTASQDVLPTFLKDYTAHTSELYSQVHQHADVMSGVICYCGCASEATEPKHESLLNCYLGEHPADKDGVTWTNHSTGCGICKKEMEEVIALSKQGKSAEEIREAIDAKYRPSNFAG
jgi:hypothetical protein